MMVMVKKTTQQSNKDKIRGDEEEDSKGRGQGKREARLVFTKKNVKKK
jgi:hypothetical protein